MALVSLAKGSEALTFAERRAKGREWTSGVQGHASSVDPTGQCAGAQKPWMSNNDQGSSPKTKASF